VQLQLTQLGLHNGQVADMEVQPYNSVTCQRGLRQLLGYIITSVVQPSITGCQALLQRYSNATPQLLLVNIRPEGGAGSGLDCKSIAIPLALLLVLLLVPLLLLVLLLVPLLLLLLLLVLVLLLLLLRTLMSAYLSPPGMTRFIQSGFLLRSCTHTTAAHVTSR
jgi:hypothetical protein